MATITATQIISRIRTVLMDTGAVRWTDAELLGWINDGQREVATLRPDSSTKYVSAPLVAGTRQSLPTDAIYLVDITRNMGMDGNTPGAPVRKVERQFLDVNVPTWHQASAQSSIVHFTYDPKAPKQFYVYPPSDGTGKVEMLYSFPPADIPNTAATLTLDDIYSNALIDYGLFRAYSKSTDSESDTQRAAAYRQSFDNILGGKAQSDETNVRPPTAQG